MVIERYGFDGYHGAHGIQPGSLLAALGLSAALVGGLVLASPTLRKHIDPILVIHNIPLAEPTPEPPPEPRPAARNPADPVPHTPPITIVDPVVPVPPMPFVPATGSTSDGADIGPITTILPPLPTPTPAPVLTGPSVDPRYARDLQPLYPAGEQRAGREGLVTVKVLVGVDGRVKQVERVSAASDAFFAATERQALSRWHFRPATRDGVPVEGWRTMTVRFVMPVE